MKCSLHEAQHGPGLGGPSRHPGVEVSPRGTPCQARGPSRRAGRSCCHALRPVCTSLVPEACMPEPQSASPGIKGPGLCALRPPLPSPGAEKMQNNPHLANDKTIIFHSLKLSSQHSPGIGLQEGQRPCGHTRKRRAPAPPALLSLIVVVTLVHFPCLKASLPFKSYFCFLNISSELPATSPTTKLC